MQFSMANAIWHGGMQFDLSGDAIFVQRSTYRGLVQYGIVKLDKVETPCTTTFDGAIEFVLIRGDMFEFSRIRRIAQYTGERWFDLARQWAWVAKLKCVRWLCSSTILLSSFARIRLCFTIKGYRNAYVFLAADASPCKSVFFLIKAQTVWA